MIELAKAPTSTWLTAPEARALLGCSDGQWVRLIRMKPFTTKAFAGSRPFYLREDVERFIRESIKPAELVGAGA